MSKLCNNCGSVNGDGQKFCSKCGNAFAQVQMPEQPQIKRPLYENTDYAAIAARKQAPVQPMQSAQQQMPLLQAPVQQKPAAQPPKAPKKKNLTPVIIAVVAAVVVVGVALGVIFGVVLPNKEKSKSESENAEAAVNGGGTSVSKIEYQPEVKIDGKIYAVQKEDVYIAAGQDQTLALKSDGTVVMVGDNGFGEGDIKDWTDIVAVSSSYYHSIGLKADGTVVAAGGDAEQESNVGDWTDIVAVSTSQHHTVGLKSDGTVVVAGLSGYGQDSVADWSDIVAVSAGADHIAGLKADGTVVAVGYNSYGQCNVADWSDIVAVSAGSSYTVGLKSDGTVVATEFDGDEVYYHGECAVDGWTDIVAVSTGDNCTVGLKADGTVVATEITGDQDYNFGQSAVDGWKDIIAISAGPKHTVGLKSDGTVVAVGDNDDGQCDVAEWSNIKTPDSVKTETEGDNDKKPSDKPDTTKPDAPTEKETKTEDKKPITSNEDELYADFIKNLSILDISDSFFGETIEDSTFSVKIKDFGSDGKKEMLTFSIVDTEYLVIRLYTAENGKVVLSDETEKQQIVGGGHYVYNCCASLDSNVIRLHCSTASFGGSSCGEEYLFYRIEDNKLNLTSDYVISEFYRYNSLVYENSVTGETYDSAESLRAAAVKTGFYPDGHFHKDDEGNILGEEVVDDDSHVFVYFCSSVFEGTHRIIYDNSDI